MDGINNIFKNNIFVKNPTNFASKQKSMLNLSGNELFKTKEEDLNKEISFYLDILYKDTDENLLKKTDKLKLTNAYLPIKCQNLHYGEFYL